MKTDQIRREFIEFFREKEHVIRPSSPLIPPGDTTMLFTSAGMVPFKDNFFGVASEPLDRAASCQKCLRETDLESVGRTARHLTFFEMLGNFSFGDYFKKEAIVWSWEFCIERLKIPAEKLWVTVFQDDDEAAEIWQKEVGLAPERIIRLGEKDNFWKMGDTGPCGPCSEIYIDCGAKAGCGDPGCAPGCECDRFREFWNLVFTQFDRQADGTLNELPRKNIDTGMGLERLATIMQNTPSVFELDVFQPIISYTSELSGTEYGYYAEKDVSFKVIADHIRCITLAVSDGIYPSNEGRGYVIRRILRRAARHGLNLGIRDSFLHKLVGPAIAGMKGGYPMLMRMREQIEKIVEAEEQRFRSTLEHGVRILEECFQRCEKEKMVPAADAFRLFDTYGFPFDLTLDMARERGFRVDEDGFRQLMENQRERARSASSLGYAGGEEESPWMKLLTEKGKTEFTGYENASGEGTVIAIVRDGANCDTAGLDTECEVALDQTPFYGESGGQVGDTGQLTAEGVLAEVVDTQKHDGIIIHRVKMKSGMLHVGDRVTARVNGERRDRIRGAHTATHLLHAALRNVLGSHVQQSGSKVEPDRLRFDFSHFEAVKPEELAAVERMVNDGVRRNRAIEIENCDLDRAIERGAMALFDEKYGQTVRVVSIPELSLELCGGCHVRQTGDIGFVKLVGESALAAGIRRVEALTGEAAIESIQQLEQGARAVQRAFHCRIEEVPELARRLHEQVKELEKEKVGFRRQVLLQKVGKITEAAESFGDIRLVVDRINGLSAEELRETADLVLDRLVDGIVVLATVNDGKVLFAAKVSPAAQGHGGHAGNLLKEAARICKGGGGGKPDSAQAGGKDPEKLDEALATVRQRLSELK